MQRLLPTLLLALPAGLAGGVLQQEPPPAPSPVRPDPRASAPYVGAVVCRNCHRQPGKGAQYTHWKERTAHARAWRTLAGAKARRIAAALGLEDPQEAPACLACHTTAAGVPKERIQRTFRVQWGVQCESCHGPGGYHKEQRMRDPRLRETEASGASTVTVEIPRDEIAIPSEKTCTACHNADSPTFRGFDFRRDLPRIAHVNPQRGRPWIPESLPPKKGGDPAVDEAPPHPEPPQQP